MRQRLEMKLFQKLSPQQIMLMKLLQIPVVALEQRIKHEIEENPALETSEERQSEEINESAENFSEDAAEKEVADENETNEFDIDAYIDDDIADYNLYVPSSSDNMYSNIPLASSTTFRDNLLVQLGLQQLTPKQYMIGEYIIGNLDDAGYLQRTPDSLSDDLLFSQNIYASTEEILDVLKIVQEFDPPGIASRSLQECLLLQLDRYPENNEIKLAKEIIENLFEEFTKKHYEKILNKLEISEYKLKKVIEIILTLNPKPGRPASETDKSDIYVIPDFIVTSSNGNLELIVNSGDIPDLRVSRSYIDIFRDFSKSSANLNNKQKEAMQFIRQKIESAKWFVDAVKQRQNTLYVTMNAIIEFQKEYFLTGDETKIRPMILKNIADRVNLDISTISRVANSKYVQTNFGTFLLKTLFSESLTTDTGEEVSNREVKKILNNTIETEDKRKTVTDEKLSAILKEKGYNVARRTIAKYRKQLGIPVARLRKKL